MRRGGANGVSGGQRVTIDTTTDRLRANCYKWLAVCFYPPDRAILMEERLLGHLSDALATVCPEAQASAEEMAKAIRQIGDEELAVDHARLFLGPFGLKAGPYGSLYLDGEGTVMGDSTMRVLQIYEQEGLEIDGEFAELPDHVAAELEFMYYLISRAVEEFGSGELDCCAHSVATQETFLAEFLLPWLHPFCNRIVDGAETVFYRALADGLLAFACRDKAYLEALKSGPSHEPERQRTEGLVA